MTNSRLFTFIGRGYRITFILENETNFTIKSCVYRDFKLLSFQNMRVGKYYTINNVMMLGSALAILDDEDSDPEFAYRILKRLTSRAIKV